MRPFSRISCVTPESVFRMWQMRLCAWPLTAIAVVSGIPAAAWAEAGQSGGAVKAAMAASDDVKARTAGEFRIGPGDILQIDVWKEPDVSTPSVVVRPDGKLSLPVVGEVNALGLTPAELQRTLSDEFNKVIRNARVTLIVREVNSQRVYLIGEVRRPGLIRFTAPVTVLQALAEAGGVTDFAKARRIYVLRNAPEGQVIFPFDYELVVRGQRVEQNIVLQPGDTIVVPR